MCFKHETQELLVRLSLQNNGFAIKAIVQQDLIWREVLDLRVTQDKAIVDVANMANKQMVIGKD